MKYMLKIMYGVVPLLALVLVITQVVVSNELAKLGKGLGKLNTDIVVQQELRADLSTQVASASSLFALRERAVAMGFLEPGQSQIISLSPDVPVALRIIQP